MKIEEGMCERLNKVIDHYCDGNYSEFARSIGVTRQAMKNYVHGRAMPAVIIAKIQLAYTELSMRWLLVGDGPMMLMDGSIARVSMKTIRATLSRDAE